MANGTLTLDYLLYATSRINGETPRRSWPRTFSYDKRTKIQKLYKAYDFLAHKGWNKEIVHEQKVRDYQGNLTGDTLPIPIYATPHKGPALWLVGGIHGEEPAGPIALAKSIRCIERLGRKIPMVVLPLCNPSGYLQDHRYTNTARGTAVPDPENTVIIGNSSTDSDHLLPDSKDPSKPRIESPVCIECDDLTSMVLAYSKTHNIRQWFDFHEDEDWFEDDEELPYIYSEGRLKREDPVAKEVVKILTDNGVKLAFNTIGVCYDRFGVTRYSEEVIDAIAVAGDDGSIDELAAAPLVFSNGEIVPGPNAETVIVTEQSILLKDNGKLTRIKLNKRVGRYTVLMSNLERLWRMNQAD
jgi:hypothetical protein